MRDQARGSDLLIGFDLGTSAIKAVLADAELRILTRSGRKVNLIAPAPECREIEATSYFDQVTAVIRDLAAASGDAKRIRALSFCGATGNTILLDREHRPVCNVISWLDQRSKEEAGSPAPGLGPAEIYEIVGWPWNGGFPLAHLGWLRRHEPSSWKKARFFAMNNDYIYHRLCGRLVTDHSKATTFYLQDQVTRRWSPRLLELLEIEEQQLPELADSGVAVGTVGAAIAAATGLWPGTLVVTGSFDHPSAARSTGVFDRGDLLISAGTSWVGFTPIGSRADAIRRSMLVDPFLSPEGPWAAMFSLTAVATKVDALIDQLLAPSGDPYRAFDDLASSSVPGASGLLVNPWQQSPEEAAGASAAFSKADAARAIMEGCVYLMRHRVEKLALNRRGRNGRVVMVGGPTKSSIWPQILADVLGTPLSVPEAGSYAGALGAALLAGKGAGLYSDERDAVSRMQSSERFIQPDRATRQAYEASYARFRETFALS